MSDNARHRRTARTGRLDVRISGRGLESVDQRAADEGLDRSELARRLLAYGVAHMPRGWHPARTRPTGGPR